MALIVQKYGGTSVGTPDRILAVAQKIKNFKEQGNQVVVVVSAMSGETDRLISLANAVSKEPSARELDVLITTGEQVTIALLSMALQDLGCSALSLTGRQAEIITSHHYGKARIESIAATKIKEALGLDQVVVVAGFQGVDELGNITSLGRGGSDTTAVAIAAALKADECQIYTDVDGVYTTDPRVVPEARRLETITFEEMLEMASLGSKVLQIRSVEFAGKYAVPLRVLSSFKEGPGTLIRLDHTSEADMEDPLISGIAFNRQEAKLTVRGVADVPGAASKILSSVADENIEVDLIIQNLAEDQTTDFSFTVNRQDYQKAKKALQQVASELGAKDVQGDDSIAKVSLVGVGMRSHAGVASKMFKALGEEKINIKMISTSEIKISVVLAEADMEAAVKCLHRAFELERA
jgi:aspartate kinase